MTVYYLAVAEYIFNVISVKTLNIYEG